MTDLPPPAVTLAPDAAYDPDSLRADVSPPFFAVSITKLVVLSVCTFGLYELCWFYRNWRLARERGEDVWPVLRTLFAIFFVYALFRRIRDGGDNFELSDGDLPAGWLALGWIVVSLLYQLPDPYWLVSFGTVAFLVPVQMAANRINRVRAPRHDPNGRFGVVNWIAVVVGGLVLALVTIGAFLPPREAAPGPGVIRL